MAEIKNPNCLTKKYTVKKGWHLKGVQMWPCGKAMLVWFDTTAEESPSMLIS